MRSATQQSEEAHVSGTANGNDLERRAEELRQIIARPSERELAQAELAKVERQRAEQKLAHAREAAHVRQTALRRAHGGQRAALTSLVERVLAEALQFRKTCEQGAAGGPGPGSGRKTTVHSFPTRRSSDLVARTAGSARH